MLSRSAVWSPNTGRITASATGCQSASITVGPGVVVLAAVVRVEDGRVAADPLVEQVHDLGVELRSGPGRRAAPR